MNRSWPQTVGQWTLRPRLLVGEAPGDGA